MPHILVIEDDAPFRQVLHIALEKAGYSVTDARNGREGVAAHTAQPADLVITDIIMPEMEGIEAIRKLRQQSPALPIIAISGGGRATPDNYLVIAKQFGATVALAKPFELATLCDAVARLLNDSKKDTSTIA